MGTTRRAARAEPSLPGDLGSKGATSRVRVIFSRRVALLTIATVLLALLLAATALAALAGPERDTGNLKREISPAIEELYLASTAGRQAQVAFEAALATDGVDRATHIADSQRFGNQAATNFARYRLLAIGTPAERKLIAQYYDTSRESQKAGAAAFGLVDSTDVAARLDAFKRQSSLAAQSDEALNTIRQRFYVTELIAGLEEANNGLEAAKLLILVVTAATIAAVSAGGTLLFRVARRDEQVIAAGELERRLEERRAGLENQLQRGLEMEPTEELTYAVIEAALRMVRPDEPIELLVADSSRAHFHQAFSTDADGGPGCAVSSPPECPAASSGQTRIFSSSERLDACPFLRGRPGEPRAATCVPVNIAGNTNGVFHTTGPAHVMLDANGLAELELVARKAGDRIGYLRVLARSQMQARVDSLTGLVNRRSLEDHARAFTEDGEPFVVAFADLDHFKDLNDTYGHEAGDRALRLFGRVLRDSVRPADVPARYGGEEFVVLFPDLALPDARMVTERIRERLRATVTNATVPLFTVSIGLSSWEPPEEFAETVARADLAMLHAKGIGRDCVVTSAEVPVSLLPIEQLIDGSEPDPLAETER